MRPKAMKKPEFDKMFSPPEPPLPEVHALALATSSSPTTDSDTLVVVIRRKRGSKGALSMDCAVARNGVLMTALPEPVGPAYEVHEVRKVLLAAERLWKRMRAGRDLPWQS